MLKGEHISMMNEILSDWFGLFYNTFFMVVVLVAPTHSIAPLKA